MRKLFLILAVIVGLAPGTWLRSPLPPADTRQVLSFSALRLPAMNLGPLEPTGAWVLHSPNDAFGSYSALAVLGDGSMLAVGDKGGTMRFSPPGTQPAPVSIGYVGGERPKHRLDLESLARDPASGRLWLGFEGANRIARFDADLRPEATVRPEAMRGWPDNQGAEAMTRLADGRFLAIAEGSQRWFDDEVPGLLFPADPTTGAKPLAFRFAPPAGYKPVAMAQLPDGRVLILLRDVVWGLPPGFSGKLLLADPAAIRAGQVWRAQELADLDAPLPTDNYEGLAVMPDGKGGAVLWLISDDNDSSAQRTILLRLDWPKAKARGRVRAPR
jgi:hypothetical protein